MSIVITMLRMGYSVNHKKKKLGLSCIHSEKDTEEEERHL